MHATSSRTGQIKVHLAGHQHPESLPASSQTTNSIAGATATHDHSK